MSICPNTGHACRCQPQEGAMCAYGPTPDDWRTTPAAPMGEELPARIVINSDGSTSTRISEYENDLEHDLAAIRDLFPAPDFGELHNLWSEAYSEPRAVVAYVKAQFNVDAERIRQLERELAERKTASIGDDPKFCELLDEFAYRASERRAMGGDFGSAEAEEVAEANLIAYIDGRSAGTENKEA